jgi:hypothetical protein
MTPGPIHLPDPSSTPIIGRTGRQERDRPIFARTAGSTEDRTQWEVEVTPLVDTTNTGRDVNPAARTEEQGPAPAPPRALFEVRAAYFGIGIPEFGFGGRGQFERKIDHTCTYDVELALAIARAAVEILAAGGGDRLDLIELARDVERRRDVSGLAGGRHLVSGSDPPEGQADPSHRV